MEQLQIFLMQFYLPLKALHIVAVISWMAAILYLPRLFVYHADAPVGGEFSQHLKVMEHRLVRFIMTPAMLTVFAFGVLLMCVPGTISKPNIWFHTKMLFVLGLSGLHGFFVSNMRAFARDERPRSSRFFRVINEVVALLMVFIVFLVVLKPF